MSDEPKVNLCTEVHICDLCLDGEGGTCWVPGCTFWGKIATDVPIRDTLLQFGGTIIDFGAGVTGEGE